MGLWIGVLLACGPAAAAQREVTQAHKIDHGIRCVIQTERPQWYRNTEAIISGTVENLTGGQLEMKANATLYLSSRTSSAMGDKFWAPADLFHDGPARTEKQSIGSIAGAEGIVSQPILLQFGKARDVVNFRIDARHLLWAREISSVWPSSSSFGTVTTDDYDLQLVLETENGRVESAKVQIWIDTSRTGQPKTVVNPRPDTDPQMIAKAMFPDAPEKTKTVDCFRNLTPDMSVKSVVQKCGGPDEELGSGIYIFVWHLADGSTVSIGTPFLEKVCDVRSTDPSGKRSSLLRCK